MISEARGNGNVDDGVVGICQKPFALFDADHIQVLFERGSGGLFEQGREVSRVQVDVSCHLFQCEFTGKISGNIRDCFFDQIVIFARYGFKHIFRKGFQRFLQAVTQFVEICDFLKLFQKMIIHLQDDIVGGAAFDGCPGEKGTKFDGSRLDHFQIAPFCEENISQQIV